MRFEVSEQIHTRRDTRSIVNALDIQLRKVSRVARQGDVITASAIEASFGSINRHDRTVFTVQPVEAGVLCVADVTYRPSVMFWIFFILGLFAYGLLFWIPIIFYVVQKKTVRSAITDVFARVKNEFGVEGKSFSSEIEGLARLAELKDRGILSGPEFESKKKEILGGAVMAVPTLVGYCKNCGSVLRRSDSRFCSCCGTEAGPRQGNL
jgi:hypothetical protein